MTREQITEIAQQLADAYPRSEFRVVVMVTDESGAFVGVGMNTGLRDARNIIRCAHEADDVTFHNSTTRQA